MTLSVRCVNIPTSNPVTNYRPDFPTFSYSRLPEGTAKQLNRQMCHISMHVLRARGLTDVLRIFCRGVILNQYIIGFPRVITTKFQFAGPNEILFIDSPFLKRRCQELRKM
jgi:hypothetical protein